MIRLAFRPVSESDRAGWLNIYHARLASFWETDSAPPPPRCQGGTLKGSIPRTPAEVSFDYSIDDDLKFSLTLLHESTGTGTGLLWTHESDPAFYDFPYRRALSELRKRSQGLAGGAWDVADIEAVVDGLICHPRVHLHINEPKLSHSLRVGAAQGNAFLFLFHLRYQACAVDAARARERSRLCDLFKEALTRKARHVPPNDLFG